MINKIITEKIIATSILILITTSLASASLSYLKGRNDGKKVERAKWEEQVENAKVRAKAADEGVDIANRSVEELLQSELDDIKKLENNAFKTVYKLEGQIESLKWELRNNAEKNTKCDGPIPDVWRLQHNKLDNILQGLSETEFKGSDKDSTRVTSDK